MQRNQLNVRISKELKDKFYNHCEEENLNPSALIRGWIAEFVEVEQKEKHAFQSKYLLPKSTI